MSAYDTLYANISDGTYFAAKKPEDCAQILMNKAVSFFTLLSANNYLVKLENMWRAYYGAYRNDLGYGHTINFTGEQGELISLPVNHFRNIAQHILVMITSTRPVMDARAVNTDYKSQAQTILANGILDYYMRQKKLEVTLRDAVEMAVVLGAGFIKLSWNATAGEIFDADPDTGEFNYEGELEFSTLTPFDVIVDGTKESWNNEWIMVRSWKNRFDLMAKYPELADKIKQMPSKSDSAIYRLGVFSNDQTDDIPIFEFFHKRTEAMPDGRYLLFVDANVILMDAKLPYRQLPIFRIAAGNIMGTPYGYSPMFDIYPIQEAINTLYSTVMTNQNAFGVQNLWVPRGADIAINQLEGAMNVIEGNEKPEPLNLTNTPKEVFDFLNMMVEAAETISGVSSVSRGNPEASLKSGTALALVQSMSLQFMSGLQQSYVELLENVGTALIEILKDFALTPKTVALVGKNNRPLLKEFTGDDLNAISRVIVDMGNPLGRCLAKDTPILMYDGTIKKVQEIKINDLIMGPDSYPRTVKNVNSGQEMMYEVTSKDPHRNIKYGCNESHILTLKYCSDDYRYDIHKGDILDITIKDYLALPARHKRLLQGFTTGVEYCKKQLPIPAYILGAWLGDGNSRTTMLTSMDEELVQEWTNYVHSIGLQVRIEENRQPNKSKNYHITSGQPNGVPDRNLFMNHLREMELILNKHIPFIYLTSNREDRLNLLAGLIDTDGYRIDETFIFTQKNEILVNDVVYLAKSLGFRVTCKKIKASSSKLVGELDSHCFKVSIGGSTHEIPTRLPRKKAKEKNKARNALNYGINIESKGFGTYYGFTLLEEPHFLLGDFTVTHNTIAGRVQMAEQMLQMHLLKTPEQYFQVMNTGRLDVTFQSDLNQLLLIQRENEELSQGNNPISAPTDRHSIHINEHASVLNDPDLRTNQQLVKVVMDHIEGHLDFLRNTDPALLALCDEHPLPPLGGSPASAPGAEPQPPQGSVGPGAPTPGTMAPPQGPNPGGPSGPGQAPSPGLPQPARPPAPFQNLPTMANQSGAQ